MTERTKNKIFQTLYFAVRAKRVESSGFPMDFANYDRRYFQQAHLANLFGGPGIVLYGNSNIEFQNAYKYMVRYPCVAVNCGLAGSLGSTLADYLIRSEGQELRALLLKKRKPIEVVNAFGNHVIQNKMDSVDYGIARIKSIMVDSYCVGLPPVHLGLLEAQAKILGVKRTKAEIDADIKLVNKKLKDAWGDKFIDVYPHLLDYRTGEAYIGMMSDAVHYSGPTRQLYVDMISDVYRRAQ